MSVTPLETACLIICIDSSKDWEPSSILGNIWLCKSIIYPPLINYNTYYNNGLLMMGICLKLPQQSYLWIFLKLY